MFKAAIFFVGVLLTVGVAAGVPLYLIRRQQRKSEI